MTKTLKVKAVEHAHCSDFTKTPTVGCPKDYIGKTWDPQTKTYTVNSKPTIVEETQRNLYRQVKRWLASGDLVSAK